MNTQVACGEKQGIDGAFTQEYVGPLSLYLPKSCYVVHMSRCCPRPGAFGSRDAIAVEVASQQVSRARKLA
jgi:hypothetical protein